MKHNTDQGGQSADPKREVEAGRARTGKRGIGGRMVTGNPAFWAKKQDREGEFAWLSLAQHLEDTRQITRLLWTHWLSEGQRQNIISSLSEPDEETAVSLAGLLGAVHDIGKATPAFQSKPGFTNSPDLDALLIEKLEREGFAGLRHANITNPEKTPHALAGQALLTEYGVGEDIASIVGAHHGRPADDDMSINSPRSYPRNYYQKDCINHPLYQRWKTEQRAIFDRAMEISGFEGAAGLPAVQQPGQVLLSGLVIMADWIASNPAYFPLVPLETAAVEDQQARIERGFTKWMEGASYPWEADAWEPDALFGKRFEFTPREIQRAFAEAAERTEQPGIFILEAPMGIGKTEAALAAAELLAHKTGRSGLFFGLPTQATSNGIFPRILKWLDSVGEDSDGRLGLRLLHGKAALNQEFDDLIQNRTAQNVNTDGEAYGNVTVNAWFSGRKAAPLDDFVVGTIDQFLMTALKQKYLALRHLGFSKKVAVLDEVHAYDAYMSRYLDGAIGWMAAYGAPVIILSATLPAERREALTKAYLRGAGYRYKECIQPPEGLRTEAYPLITYTDGRRIRQATFAPAEEKTVRIERYESCETEDIVSLTADLLREGEGVIGVIVNTVKRAQECAAACSRRFGEENVMLLHSAFIAPDRIEKEARLLGSIGKGAERPAQKIIIGTQVIEQSLDIDFDALLSDLAPADLLIQRAGRLHRHENPRPQRHRLPVLHVFGAGADLDFEPGGEAVYGGYLLARTAALLPETLSLPGDISPLVQRVYGGEDPPYTGAQQTRYLEMKAEHEAFVANQKEKAETYRIESPRRKDSLVGWLKNSHPNESEERAYAQVRDTRETLEVIALQKTGDGYGFFGTGEDISERIEESAVARRIAQQTLRLPRILSSTYRIDGTIQELERYNLKYLGEWQKQPWLKHSLGILFEEDGSFRINGYRIQYDENIGLSYMKEEGNESFQSGR